MYCAVICLYFIAIDLNIAERIFISDSEYIVPEFPPGILSIIKNRKEKEKALESNTIKESNLRSGNDNLPVENIEQEIDDRDYTVPDLTLNDLFNYSNNNSINKLDPKEEMAIEARAHNPNSYLEIIKSSKESSKPQYDEIINKNSKEKQVNNKKMEEELRSFDLDALIAQSEMEASKTFEVMDYVTKTLNGNDTDTHFNERVKQAVRINDANLTGPSKERLFEIASKINETYYKKLPNRNNIRNLNERVKAKDDYFDVNFFRGSFGEEFPDGLYKNNNVMKNLTDAVNAMPEFKETPKVLAPKYLKVVEKGQDVEVRVTERNHIEGAKMVKKMIRSPIDDLRNDMMRIYRKSTDDILKNFDPKLVLQSPVNVELDTILKIMKQQQQSDEKHQTKHDEPIISTSIPTSRALRGSYQEPDPEDDDRELNDLIFNKIVL